MQIYQSQPSILLEGSGLWMRSFSKVVAAIETSNAPRINPTIAANKTLVSMSSVSFVVFMHKRVTLSFAQQIFINWVSCKKCSD